MEATFSIANTIGEEAHRVLLGCSGFSPPRLWHAIAETTRIAANASRKQSIMVFPSLDGSLNLPKKQPWAADGAELQ